MKLFKNKIKSKSVDTDTLREEFTDEEKKILRNIDVTKIVFRKTKRTRYKIQKNDIFAIEIFDDVFVYGAILNPKIHTPKCLVTNNATLFVYFDYISRGINYNGFLQSDKKLLVAPFMSTDKLVSQGFIRILGNCELPKIDYGFYSEILDAKTMHFVKQEKYMTEYKKILKKKPKYSRDFGLITHGGALTIIYKRFIIESKLLYIDGEDSNYLLEEILKD